jgi:HTH-type transcriptional regulator/antitoxin HigA
MGRFEQIHPNNVKDKNAKFRIFAIDERPFLLFNGSVNKTYQMPGQLIQELLDERGWMQKVLAAVLGLDETIINKVILGKRALDADMALALAEIFDVPAERFLELQKSYELAQARFFSLGDPSLEKRAQIFASLPVPEMVKRRWLTVDDIRNFPKLESALTKFFGVPSIEEIEVLPHAAKKTNVIGDVTATQIAWLYRVKQIANELLVSRYSPIAVKNAIPKLSALLLSANEARNVPRILAECGIRYVVVEKLTGAKIDGVCFWLNDTSPVIAMSLQHDRIDNFWFVLRHEIEHVLRLQGRASIAIDSELEGEKAGVTKSLPEEERIANEAASEFCVPKKSLDALIARKAPFFAGRDILGFARSLSVHPGLVAGQLRHRLNRYDRFGKHLVKIRSIVAPNAAVDGWGDVYPVEEE